ncbi:Alpha/Beta hydrolase protein [Piptocephalis cylindrospora]|uniref:Alpha/Beta hydrolase protein n=1 Tax=Piptocephalis cylindrospora TaxID=1907219 RepID=A0A4P9Y3D8_9FUNG|nr:Alpha/Beta hydrolase protein [Piptocephalis cylindrospora]RKP13417.1 Alpha/Beta hydrolase protein [Piptocephalis cylindrospora]|eukprot:RKP12726.1 Alpha/Beta hydrolase protein [Piptocephalis cylindrospora]
MSVSLMDEIPDASVSRPDARPISRPTSSVKRRNATRCLQFLALIPLFYAALILVACLPGPQRSLVYMNGLNFPLGVNFSQPESLGFARGRVRPLELVTMDDVRLRAFLFLPLDLYHHEVDTPNPEPEGKALLDRALAERETVIYLHGNAGNMALGPRMHTCRRISEYMGMNALILDYRGFGGSEGTPSEEGLIQDARSAWDWLRGHGVPAQRITLLGHSLGTGVATRLTHSLQQEGGVSAGPRALLLKSPYTSLPEVVTDFRFFRFLPLFGPLRYLPGINSFISRIMDTHFSTHHYLPMIQCDVAILHGTRDDQIPVDHAHRLRDLLLGPIVGESGEEVLLEEASFPLVSIPNAYNVLHVADHHRHILFLELTHATHNDIQEYDVTWESLRVFLRGRVG